jgi:hypothetical protein
MSQRSGSINNEVDDTFNPSWSNSTGSGNSSSDKTKTFPTIELVMEISHGNGHIIIVDICFSYGRLWK